MREMRRERKEGLLSFYLSDYLFVEKRAGKTLCSPSLSASFLSVPIFSLLPPSLFLSFSLPSCR